MGKAMAYRRSNGKARMKKIEPAVTRLTFQAPTDLTGAITTQYLDLSLAASLVNRRFYRQGVKWAVAGITIIAKGTGAINVSKVPETWVAHNAWKKSFAMWRKMNDQVLDDEPGIQGAYHDFKIYADETMIDAEIQQSTSAGVGPFILTPRDSLGNLTAADFTGVNAPRADWNYSTVQIPNDGAPGTTIEHTMHFVGDTTATSVGLINGYALSRSRPQHQDPNVPVDGGWMNELFDLGENNEEIRADLVFDNDRAPYATYPADSGSEAYPGGSGEYPALQLVDTLEFTSTTVSGKNSIPGGIYSCGLIRIDAANNATAEGGFANYLIQVDLVPGGHRGYLCESMNE